MEGLRFATGVGQHHQEQKESRQAEEGEAPRSNPLAQRPQQHRQDNSTEQADRSE